MGKGVPDGNRTFQRDVTKSEIDRVTEGFREHGREQGVPDVDQVRISIAAMDGDQFVGCASGKPNYNWFLLDHLWLDSEYRGRGIGSDLLKKLEAAVRDSGLKKIYTGTAEYQAPEFYKKHGYQVYGELEDFFPTGHSKIYLRKSLN